MLDDRATPPKVEILKLDAGFTARLAARARQEGTTVHGALCSAADALAQQRQPGVLRKVAEVMTQVVASGIGVEQAAGSLATALAFDAIVSNFGRLDIETTGDGLKLTSIWGSSLLTGLADEQIIGVSTPNGQMHLAYTSCSHAAGLLRATEKLFHQVN
jgi:hypothetical protein